ncbi:hypothetical protein GCM10010207_19260 [Streptomyces atratus]|nr:hypothetical protein GCM10010207_19260 [Streptomyces atratus]
MLTFAGTVITVLLVGFDVPARLNRLTDPDAERNHLAVPLETERDAASRMTASG